MTDHLKQKIKERGINLNTVMISISIATAFITAVLFFAPLKTLPDDMKTIKIDMEHMQKMQAVQAETLKILAEVSADTKETRHQFDRHSSKVDSEINIIMRRIEFLDENK